MFGMWVCESFFSNKTVQTGIYESPNENEDIVGGHSMLLTGYNDVTRYFKVINCCGTDWGKDGFVYVPYDIILNPDIAWDFWIILA
jgi:C1A family cysteine protease